MLTFLDLMEVKKKNAERIEGIKKDIDYYIALRRSSLIFMEKAYDKADMNKVCELKKVVIECDNMLDEKYKELEEANRMAPSDVDIKKAWEKHIEEYNCDFSSVYSEYEESRKNLARRYIDLISLQNNILKKQNEIKSYFPESFFDGIAAPMFLRVKPGNTVKYRGYYTAADIAFLYANEEISSSKASDATNIVLDHIPSNKF